MPPGLFPGGFIAWAELCPTDPAPPHPAPTPAAPRPHPAPTLATPPLPGSLPDMEACCVRLLRPDGPTPCRVPRPAPPPPPRAAARVRVCPLKAESPSSIWMDHVSLTRHLWPRPGAASVCGPLWAALPGTCSPTRLLQAPLPVLVRTRLGVEFLGHPGHRVQFQKSNRALAGAAQC